MPHNTSILDESGVREELISLKSDFSALRTDVRDLTRALGRAGRHAASDAKDHVAETASHIMDSTTETGRRAADSVENQVHERPFTSLGVAFAAGLALGAIALHRRGSS